MQLLSCIIKNLAEREQMGFLPGPRKLFATMRLAGTQDLCSTFVHSPEAFWILYTRYIYLSETLVYLAHNISGTSLKKQ